MKKSIAFAASLAMAMSYAAVPTMASANKGGSNDVAAACNGGLADALGISQGTCVVALKDGDAIGLCKLLKDRDLLEAFGFRNQGQCLKALG